VLGHEWQRRGRRQQGGVTAGDVRAGDSTVEEDTGAPLGAEGRRSLMGSSRLLALDEEQQAGASGA
jgi:hypothetical protein